MIRMFTALILLIGAPPALAGQRNVDISGSVQFWQRSCSADYECGLPTAVSERIPVASVITEPQDVGRVSMETIHASSGSMTAKLSVFWKKETTVSYLAGQSLLAIDGTRVAECSHYGSSDVKQFIPVGFCAGYIHSEDGIVQYGITYYKAQAE